MMIFVKAKPKAKAELIEKIDGEHFVVSVKEPPIQGRANAAMVRILADYFKVAMTEVKIIAGHISRNKIVEIKKER